MPPQSFWDFSLAFYALPGVPDACLELQDRAGVDVNVMLYLLYAALEGRMLAPADVERIEAVARPWRQAVVVPLRSVRRALKEPVGAFEPARSAALRSDVKRIELAAERLQQEALEALVPPVALGSPQSDPVACAGNNLRLYAQRLPCWQAQPAERILASFAAYAGGALRSREW
mgnify:CR=1 FL=1